MAIAGSLKRFGLFGFVGRERGVSVPIPDETYFFDEPLTQKPRKVNCGPRIGDVVELPDGSVIVTKDQLVVYTGYEVKNNLPPANVDLLPDGRFQVSMRK